MDSTIRVRQLNQPELSGFVSGVISLYPQIAPSGNIVPSGSGIYNLGASSYPYSHVYSNEINLPSGGSGIKFGNTNFYAYVSGGSAYINVGGISISSTGESFFLIGPSGATGPSGTSGATGLSGVGVTGITYNSNTYALSFYLSNNSVKTFDFRGLSGSSGVSVTGFYQSGNYAFPQFDNFKGTGAPIQLVAGPAGPPGSLNLFFQKSGASVFPGTNFPQKAIINPYYSNLPAPDISLMRGMVYTFDVSGLNTYTITSADTELFKLVFSGQAVPFQTNDKINYFKTGSQTGYWRLAFFPNNTATGYYSSLIGSAPLIFSETSNFGVSNYSATSNIYRTKYSFAANFAAQDNYKYGFMVYTIGNDTTYDAILGPTGYAYVLGSAYFSSGVGPPGPSGALGIGMPGNVGPKGNQGDDGAGIVAYTYSGAGDDVYIQFQLSNNSSQPWVPLPKGGAPGANGPVGSLINLFSGEYNNSYTYAPNTTITFSGSSYISTGISSISNITPPTSPWQLIAQKGDAGPSGATGISGSIGPAGSISNSFSGVWNGAKSYPNSCIVFLSGSSYVNTGSTNNNNPTGTPWTMLAQKGDTGAQGLSGVPTLLRSQSSGLIYGKVNGASDNIVLDPNALDMFSLVYNTGVLGNANGVTASQITISGNNFPTGKSIIIAIRNVNAPQNDGAHNPLFNFTPITVGASNANIKWPNDVYSFPNIGKANIYTLLRFPDETGAMCFYGTYSNPYN